MVNDGVDTVLEIFCFPLFSECQLNDFIFFQKFLNVIHFLCVFFSVHVCQDAWVSA